jgi:hypothetical protein
MPCFTAPATRAFDLLSLGSSPTYFADGFSIDTPQLDFLWGRGASIDSVLYPGFNSETGYGFRGIGPHVDESVFLITPQSPNPPPCCCSSQAYWPWRFSGRGRLLLSHPVWMRRREEFQNSAKRILNPGAGYQTFRIALSFFRSCGAFIHRRYSHAG